jgi:hypothetical protein
MNHPLMLLGFGCLVYRWGRYLPLFMAVDIGGGAKMPHPGIVKLERWGILHAYIP